MLAQIMHEVAQEAAEKHKKAEARYFAGLRKLVEETQALWKDRIEAAING